ncbi:MAG: hypothetical protein E7424_06465 [Ruminococcaceae bacterium]|jgi:tetratricopeptide (TPR) repeat protein|nr:hypothetical protein [Oscillospiraceae bacterium]
MQSQVQIYLDDARKLQKNGDYEQAISFLKSAYLEDSLKLHEIEIEKLLSFNYRKTGDYNLALLHINRAINRNSKKWSLILPLMSTQYAS